MAVGALVPQEVGAVAEGLATVWALVGLLTRVRALVAKQVRAVSEGLAATGTLVGPLARVRALVFDEVRALGEGLATDLTFIGFFTCVDALVLDQGGAPPKTLPTDAADVRPRALPTPGPATPSAWTTKGPRQAQGILEHLKLGCSQQGPCGHLKRGP